MSSNCQDINHQRTEVEYKKKRENRIKLVVSENKEKLSFDNAEYNIKEKEQNK